MEHLSYEENAYRENLKIRFPFLKNKTQEELYNELNANKDRDPSTYDPKKFLKYEKNLKKKFSPYLKNKIIKNKAEKYLQKGWYDSYEEAYERSVSEMMPTRQYTKFSAIANQVFETMGLVPNFDNMICSVNRIGGFSWYLRFEYPEPFCIKISDHIAVKSLRDKQGYPIADTIIVDADNNSYCEIDGSVFNYEWQQFDNEEMYESMQNIIDEYSIKGLKKFLRQWDLSFLKDPKLLKQYIEDQSDDNDDY